MTKDDQVQEHHPEHRDQRHQILDNLAQRPVAIITSLLLLAVLCFSVIRTFKGAKVKLPGGAATNTAAISDAIFGQYLIPFEVVSVLLLAALIGAIVLARKE